MRMAAVPGPRHLARHVLKREIHTRKSGSVHQLHKLEILLEQPHLDAFGRVQCQMLELVLMLKNQAQKALYIRLLKKEVVFVEPEVMDPVAVILVADLVERVPVSANSELQ